MIGRIDQPEQASAITVDIWRMDGLTASGFLQLRNARKYSEADITRLVSWFNAVQEDWGVGEILLRAIQDYCRELALEYFGVVLGQPS